MRHSTSNLLIPACLVCCRPPEHKIFFYEFSHYHSCHYWIRPCHSKRKNLYKKRDYILRFLASLYSPTRLLNCKKYIAVQNAVNNLLFENFHQSGLAFILTKATAQTIPGPHPPLRRKYIAVQNTVNKLLFENFPQNGLAFILTKATAQTAVCSFSDNIKLISVFFCRFFREDLFEFLECIGYLLVVKMRSR